MSPRGRSVCSGVEWCVYGSSEIPSLINGCNCLHAHRHKQGPACNKGHICWYRYKINKDMITATCRDTRRRHGDM